MTDHPRSPFDALLDAVVYAPIGAAFHGPETVSELARKGRGQVANARVIGTFAVQKASVQARAWAESAQQVATDAVVAAARAAGAPLAGSDPSEAAEPQPKGSGTRSDRSDFSHLSVVPDEGASGEANASEPRSAPAVPPAELLPIPDYDTLSASQVVPRLDDLAHSELAVVDRYERAHRGRMTILGRIAQLQAS